MPHSTEPEVNYVRFHIPAPFEGSDEGMVIEMRAYVEGPRGGAAEPIGLPDDYWRGLIKKLAEQQVEIEPSEIG